MHIPFLNSLVELFPEVLYHVAYLIRNFVYYSLSQCCVFFIINFVNCNIRGQQIHLEPFTSMRNICGVNRDEPDSRYYPVSGI